MRTLLFLSTACTVTPASRKTQTSASPKKTPVTPDAVRQNPAGVWVHPTFTNNRVVNPIEFGLIAPDGDFRLARAYTDMTKGNGEYESYQSFRVIAGKLSVDNRNALTTGKLYGDMLFRSGFDYLRDMSTLPESEQEDIKRNPNGIYPFLLKGGDMREFSGVDITRDLSGAIDNKFLSASIQRTAKPNPSYAFKFKRSTSPSKPQSIVGNYVEDKVLPLSIQFNIDGHGQLEGTIGTRHRMCSLSGTVTKFDNATPNFYKVKLEVQKPSTSTNSCEAVSSQTGYGAFVSNELNANLPHFAFATSNSSNEAFAAFVDKQ